MNFKKRHEHYRDSAAIWAKLSAAYTGQGVEGFLRRARIEGNQDWSERQQAASLLYRNYPALAASLYSSTIYGKPPSRELPPDVARLLTDVDRQGTDANEFFQQVASLSLVFGVAFVSCDLPALPEGLRATPTKANRDALRHWPYLSTYSPSEVYDWATDGAGQLLWVALASTYSPTTAAPFEEDTTRPAVLVWTREDWTLWVEEEGKLEPVTMGSNPFAPTVPLVAFYSDRTGPMMARSPLEPVSDLSLEMLNVSSLLSMALGYCAIPQLVIHSRADMPNVGLGRSRAVALDQGDKAEYLFLPKQGVDALLETAGMLRRDIRDAIMRRIDLTRESAQRETAQAKAMDLSALHAFLCGVAKNMEEAEAKTWGLMCIGMGADPAKVSVSYNRRYDLRSASERLDEALKASALGLPSPTFRKEYTTALAKALLEDAAPEVVAQVVAELEQAEG